MTTRRPSAAPSTLQAGLPRPSRIAAAIASVVISGVLLGGVVAGMAGSVGVPGGQAVSAA